MLQLVYLSTARPSLDQHEIGRILAVSRRRNQLEGITGLLVHDGVRFMQVLEGDRARVEAAYARIRGDHRHRAPLVLSDREVKAREFGDSPLASSRVAGIDRHLPLAGMIDGLVDQVGDPTTRALFRGFARIERRAA